MLHSTYNPSINQSFQSARLRRSIYEKVLSSGMLFLIFLLQTLFCAEPASDYTTVAKPETALAQVLKMKPEDIPERMIEEIPPELLIKSTGDSLRLREEDVKTISICGSDVMYAILGPKEPDAIVFIHSAYTNAPLPGSWFSDRLFHSIRAHMHNCAFVIHNRPGYVGSSKLLEPPSFSSTCEFNKEFKAKIIETFQEPPKRVVNFGHSLGGMRVLTEILMRLRETGGLDAVKKEKWILADPFIPDIFFERYYPLRYIVKPLSWMVHKEGEYWCIGKVRDVLGVVLRWVVNSIDWLIKTITPFISNLMEVLTSPDFGAQFRKQIDELAENSPGLDLYVFGCDLKHSFMPGFASDEQYAAAIQKLARLSRNSNPCKVLDASHIFATEEPKGQTFEQMMLESHVFDPVENRPLKGILKSPANGGQDKRSADEDHGTGASEKPKKKVRFAGTQVIPIIDSDN